MLWRGFSAILWLSAAAIATAQQAQVPAVSSQTDAAQSNPSADPNARPLTPEEQRERQIREADPLDPANPANPGAALAPDDSKDKDARDLEKRRKQDEKPLPGSIAASDQANAKQGPEVVDEDQGDSSAQSYAGPAVLSRSYTIDRPMNLQDLKWNENVGVSAIYDTGLTEASLTPQGTVSTSGSLYGTGLSYGFRGRHLWHHDQLGVNLNGQYSEYLPTSRGFNGLNTTLSVDYAHIFSPHLAVHVVGNGTDYSQNYNLESSIANPSISVADVNLTSSPNIQIFDLSTKQFSLQTNVTWQETARLSFSFGGSYFAVDRGSAANAGVTGEQAALLGVTGEQATGDVNYRWSYRTTVGAYYSYSYYLYPHGTDVTDSNTVGLVYSYAFSKELQLRLRGGVSDIESLGITTVPLNPLIAALLGQSTGIIDAYNRYVTSDISAQLVRDFHNGRTASINFVRGLSPGNGVIQGSVQESAGVSVGTRLFRRYTLSFAASRDSLTSVSQTIAGFTSESATIALSRSYARGISANFLIAYRYFNIGDAIPIRNELRVTSGISWGSANGRLWPF